MPITDLVPGQVAKFGYTPLQLRVLASLEGMPPNNVFFVDSTSSARGGADATNGGTKAAPFLTWNYAYTQCLASRGDVIVGMPGHVETLSVAAAVAANIAGVRTIGMGVGANRPTFTFAGVAGASVLITAANTKIWNIVGIAGLDLLTNPFHIQAADCELDIEWRDGSATVEAVRAILTTAAADRLSVNLRYYGFTTGDAVANAVRLVGCNGGRITVDAFGLCSTAWVEFSGTACSDIVVKGRMFTQGITNFTRDVVDTIGGSTWSAEIFDASAGANVSGGSAAALAVDDVSVVAGNLLVPTADVATNTAMRDVVGNKTDAGVQAVTTTASLMAYIKAILDQLSGTAGLTTFPAEALAANAVSLAEVLRWIQNGVRSGTGTALATNESIADVLYAANGIAVFPAAQLPANNVSIAEVLRETYDQQEKSVVNTTAVLVNTTTIFTIAGGPIEILSLVARCVTGNDGTASTLQWSADPTDGAAATFSGVSASLANAAAGAMAILQGTALTTAPIVNATGVGLSMSGATPTLGIIVGAGIITTTIAAGSTTGTWQHHMRYRPLSRGVTVV